MYKDQVEIKRLTLNKFCQGIEQIINDLVQENLVLNWDEDYLTRKFLSELTKHLSGSLISDLSNSVVFLTPYKLSKPEEFKFGDIGIVARIEYEDGDIIEGISFIEAKRKYKESRKYDAMDWEQLERIYANAPHSQLLLYDFRDITEFAPTGLVNKKDATASSPMAQLPVTKFVTIPLNKAVKVRKNNERLYKLSLPFSYQFGYRYLNGFDLDYRSDILDQIKKDFSKNYINIEKQVPEYLIYINITSEKNIETEPFSYDRKRYSIVPNTGINEELYLKIKPKE